MIKKKVCQTLLSRSATFISLVHPSVIIGENIELGNGVVLCPRVTLTADISIGDFVAISCHSSVGHDAVIGDSLGWSSLRSEPSSDAGVERARRRIGDRCAALV